MLVITSAEPGVLPDPAIFQRAPRMVRAVFRKPIDVEELTKCVEMYLRAADDSVARLDDYRNTNRPGRDIVLVGISYTWILCVATPT